MVDNVKMQFKFLKARMRAGNVKLLEHATSTLFEVSAIKDQRSEIKIEIRRMWLKLKSSNNRFFANPYLFLITFSHQYLIQKGHVCALCGPWLFSAPEMINHIATTMHIEKVGTQIIIERIIFFLYRCFRNVFRRLFESWVRISYLHWFPIQMNGLVCADAFDFWWNAVVVKQPEVCSVCSENKTDDYYLS